MTGRRLRPARRRADRDPGSDPGAAAPAHLGVRDRARLRRRLRELRALRELALRDLGGLIFDLYRFGRQRDALVRDKLERALAVDEELRALEVRLDGDVERGHELRLTGVGGSCPSCDEPFGSSASYCARCGVLLGDGRPSEEVEQIWDEGQAGWTDELPAFEPQPPADDRDPGAGDSDPPAGDGQQEPGHMRDHPGHQ